MTLIILALIFGTALGMRCKIFVLIRVLLVVSACLATIGLAQGNTSLFILISLAGTITALQIGYLIGAFIHPFTAENVSLKRSHKAHYPNKESAARQLT